MWAHVLPNLTRDSVTTCFYCRESRRDSCSKTDSIYRDCKSRRLRYIIQFVLMHRSWDQLFKVWLDYTHAINVCFGCMSGCLLCCRGQTELLLANRSKVIVLCLLMVWFWTYGYFWYDYIMIVKFSIIFWCDWIKVVNTIWIHLVLVAFLSYWICPNSCHLWYIIRWPYNIITFPTQYITVNNVSS